MNDKESMRKAMDKVVEEMPNLSVSPMPKDDEGPIDKQVLIRVTEIDREKWKKAAEISGVNLSTWIRHILNEAATDLLECRHPINRRKYYPWAEFCLECGVRLSNT